jgi:hypothetical protein
MAQILILSRESRPMMRKALKRERLEDSRTINVKIQEENQQIKEKV